MYFRCPDCGVSTWVQIKPDVTAQYLSPTKIVLPSITLPYKKIQWSCKCRHKVVAFKPKESFV